MRSAVEEFRKLFLKIANGEGQCWVFFQIGRVAPKSAVTPFAEKSTRKHAAHGLWDQVFLAEDTPFGVSPFARKQNASTTEPVYIHNGCLPEYINEKQVN